MPRKTRRFSEEVEHILTLAQEEAEKRGHETIGMAHLLLALQAKPPWDGLSDIRQWFAALNRIRNKKKLFTQDAEGVLALAQEEAEQGGVNRIDSRHLLLALIHEPEGTVGDVLRALGLDAAQVDAVVRKKRRWFSSRTEPISTSHPQPLLILDENGEELVSNQSATDLMDNHMEELLEALRQNAGDTSEVPIGNQTYHAMPCRLSDARTIVILRDITEAKEREYYFEGFISEFYHEFKTPLMVIRGWCRLLPLTKGKPNYSEIVSEYAKFIEGEVYRADVVLSLMAGTFYPIDTNRRLWQPCDLPELVEKVIAEIQGATDDPSETIQLEVLSDRCQVSGDQRQLERMVFTLIANAVVRHPWGQRSAKVIVDRDTGAIQLRIQQRGHLVSKDDLSHIFKKYDFYWVGLSTVKAIVEMHDGTVEATSLPEGGVEFVVQLPALQED